MNKEKIKEICFNIKPQVCVRIIEDTEPEEIIKQKKKYPFELNNTIAATISTDKRIFTFYISKGYTWNGADIPRFFWRVIGSRTDNDFLVASMLHDYLLEFKSYIINEILKNQISVNEYRRLTSLIFREKIKSQGTCVIKANIMAWSVDVFQKYFNRKAWKI